MNKEKLISFINNIHPECEFYKGEIKIYNGCDYIPCSDLKKDYKILKTLNIIAKDLEKKERSK